MYLYLSSSLLRTKLTALVLAFLFMLLPLGPVLATTATAPSEPATEPAPESSTAQPAPSAAPADTGTVTSPTPAITDQSQPADTSPSQASPTAAPTDAKSSATSPTAQASTSSATSSTAATTNGSPSAATKQILPQTDQSTGALVYSYPLAVPPGRNGLQPDLALTYNSQQGITADNIVGYGWSLNIPSITRLNKTGTEKLYTDNYFSSSLSGELVLTSGTAYAAKVENGDYLKYAYNGTSWTVTDKKGTVYKFGQTAAARQDDPAATKTYKWLLSEVRDTNSNYISYTYTKDAGQIYPNQITYTGNGTTPGALEVDFTIGARTDVVSSYSAGFNVTTNYQLTGMSTKVNAVLAHTYTLAYTTGDKSARPFLSSITESGTDETTLVTTTLPAQSFTYQTHGSGWTDATITVPYYVVGGGHNEDAGTRFGDVNGDGLLDIVVSNNFYPNPVVKQVWLNQGNGTWSQATGWTIPVPFTDCCGPTPLQAELADVNGDGLADIVFSNNGNLIYGSSGAYLNTGSGWSTNWIFPTDVYNLNDIRILDVNADGLPDLMRSTPSGWGNAVYVNLGQPDSSGYVWTKSNQLSPPSWPSVNYTYYDNGVRNADVNGDGLEDVIYSVRTDTGYPNYSPIDIKQIGINNGTGSWLGATSYVIPTLFSVFGSDEGVRLIDLNGDGLVDIIKAKHGEPRKVWMNNGSTWVEDASWVVPNDFVVDWYNNLTQMDYNFYDNGQRLMDVNGDGLPDWFGKSPQAPGSPWTVYSGWAGSTKADLMSKVTYPQGGLSLVTYRATPRYANSNGANANPQLPLALDTVQQLVTQSGTGAASTAAYTYEGGKMYFDASAPFDRKFAGFAKVASTDSAGVTTSAYYHQGDASNAAQGEYLDHVSKIGKVYRTEVMDSSGNLYSKSIAKWENVDLGQGRNFVKQTQSVGFTYDGNVSHRDKAATSTYDDTNGNVLQQTQWGEVAANDDGTFADVGSDQLTSTTSYAAGGTRGVIGLPASTVTLDQSGTKVAETRSYYDTLTLGSVDKGNLTKAEQWVAGSTYVNTQKTYNAYGLVTQELDPRGKAVSYTYDSLNPYPSAVTNALSQTTQYLYDYSVGKPKQVIDSNAHVFQTMYDGLDRVVEVKQPDLAAPASLVTKSTYTYTDTPGAVSLHQTDYLDAGLSVDSYVYYDGLGRALQTRTEAELPGTFAVTDVAYNTLGQLSKQSLPYFGSGSSKTTPTAAPELYTTYTYDALGRALTAVNAVGTTSTAYDDWKTTTTDARGNQKSLTQDATGNLVQVVEPGGGATTYAYNPLGSLTGITDAAGNVRQFTYDGLGRRLTAQDLHAPADSTFGTWAYTYDASSNLTQKLDPKGQTINYTYDDVNRPLTEDFTGQAGTEVTTTYDTCPNGVGKLCSTVSSALNETEQYDALGNVSRDIKTISSVAYQTDYTYDRAGNQASIANPDNSQVKYLYNSAGLLEQVQRKEASDGTFTNVVASFDYSPTGAVATQVNANGTTTTNTYNSSKFYRLTSKLTTASGGTKLQNLSYTYDAVGNITRLVDASQTNAAKTVDYTYDSLNRLTQATASGVAAGQNSYSYTYSYDQLGNILTRAETIGTSPATSYTYSYSSAGYANPHAVTSITSGVNTVTYTYDNNGNLTNDGTKTYTWDYANRLVRVDLPGSAPVPVTTSFYPSSGDGSVAYQSSTSWSTAYNAPTGSTASATGTTLNVDTGLLNGGKFAIERAFVPFDTSALPDNATVASARLKLYVAAKLNSDNDGQDFVTIAQGLEPSTTSLGTADYDLAGTINAPQEGVDVAERKDITSVAAGAYLTFNLNATGQGWISKTGVSKLALREGHDVLNTPFVGAKNQYNQLQVRTSEYTGTTNDPVLEVTYTTPPPMVTSTYTYDASGQRVKVISGGVTTIYPTKEYNTDGTTAMKHIFAEDMNIGTVKGAGTSATMFYTHTDQLTGSNVVTNSTGVQQELLDYYPFGSIRLDEKAGTFSEQRKFTGYEYDSDTSLNYAQARYQNPALGKFISQDPMFWELSQGYLLDPQLWNSYSYARNNPLNTIDPTGEEVIEVDGTWDYRGSQTDAFAGAGREYAKTIGEHYVNFNDAIKDYDMSRFTNATALAHYINENHYPGEGLTIFAHSHGGNVVAESSHMISRTIDDLVTVGTPNTFTYQPDYSHIANHIQVYSNSDGVQAFGGTQFSAISLTSHRSGLLGSLLRMYYASRGLRDGMGEFGIAGRTFPGAKNLNLETLMKQNSKLAESFKGQLGPKATHGAMWGSKELFEVIKKSLSR